MASLQSTLPLTSPFYCYCSSVLTPSRNIIYSIPNTRITTNRCKTKFSKNKMAFWGDLLEKDSILVRKLGRRRLLSVVRARKFPNFGGGGGGWDKSSTTRIVGNLALAVILTYLTMTGQLGWLLDAIVSIWLLALLIPILGIGAFFWFAGQDIVRSSCPNCANDFQIFKSFMNDGPQLCPYCSQPFSVEGNKFVREPPNFSSNRSTKFGQAFDVFSPRVDKEKAGSATVVDIEAEVKDIE